MPRDLRAMSKTELVALVLELQAREATPLRPTEDPTTKSEDWLKAGIDKGPVSIREM